MPAMRRLRVVVAAGGATVFAVAAVAVWLAFAGGAGIAAWRPGGPASEQPAADLLAAPTTPPPPPMPTLAAPADPTAITAEARLFGWALLDRRTGAVTGSANSATALNTVESMIKPWIAADYLRRLTESGEQPTEQAVDEITLMIIDSNDPMAEKYYRLGGADAVVDRMISICGLEQVRIRSTLWSWTEMTPQDTVRYGECLADGRAAGPQWTQWILDTMREVRGTLADQKSGAVQGGRWGIIDGLPPELAESTSIKNGWTSYRDGWHVNCLAVHRDWTLGIMIRSTRGLAAAADICKQVTESLVVTPPS
jgi:hypothetical protein